MYWNIFLVYLNGNDRWETVVSRLVTMTSNSIIWNQFESLALGVFQDFEMWPWVIFYLYSENNVTVVDTWHAVTLAWRDVTWQKITRRDRPVTVPWTWTWAWPWAWPILWSILWPLPRTWPILWPLSWAWPILWSILRPKYFFKLYHLWSNFFKG